MAIYVGRVAHHSKTYGYIYIWIGLFAAIGFRAMCGSGCAPQQVSYKAK